MSKKLNLNRKDSFQHVWSIALCGCETWINGETERKALEIWCWRSMQKISWMERKINQDVLKITDKKCLLIIKLLKEMANNRIECRRKVANQPTG